MTYDYNKDLSTKHYEVKIATADSYGYFEHNAMGDESAGGLWFEGKELVDYDGVFDLPAEVKQALTTAGYIGDALA